MALTLWSVTLTIWTLVSIACAAFTIFALMQPFWVVNHSARKSFGLYSYCKFESESNDGGTSWLDPLTGSIVDVVVVDGGGGFEVVGGVLADNVSSGDHSGKFFNASSITNNHSLSSQAPSSRCGELFGSYYYFQHVFTSELAWKIAGSLYTGSALLFSVAAVAAVVIVFLNDFDVNLRRLCRLAGFIQLTAVGLSLLALATFPAIMTSDTASSFCPLRSISVNFPPPIFASVAPPQPFRHPSLHKSHILLGMGGESETVSDSYDDEQPIDRDGGGECYFGWAFVLAAMNVPVSIFLPILSHLVVSEPDMLQDYKMSQL